MAKSHALRTSQEILSMSERLAGGKLSVADYMNDEAIVWLNC